MLRRQVQQAQACTDCRDKIGAGRWIWQQEGVEGALQVHLYVWHVPASAKRSAAVEINPSVFRDVAPSRVRVHVAQCNTQTARGRSGRLTPAESGSPAVARYSWPLASASSCACRRRTQFLPQCRQPDWISGIVQVQIVVQPRVAVAKVGRGCRPPLAPIRSCYLGHNRRGERLKGGG